MCFDRSPLSFRMALFATPIKKEAHSNLISDSLLNIWTLYIYFHKLASKCNCNESFSLLFPFIEYHVILSSIIPSILFYFTFMLALFSMFCSFIFCAISLFFFVIFSYEATAVENATNNTNLTKMSRYYLYILIQ